ncbi:uncharacterized protein [Henckelia pumila]|uniref:uncharacterized protein n=1 Tax=Henckelia pumila TaxID=405737 RepID=UPI003C6DD994
MSTTNEYILKTDVTRLEKIVREQSSEIENLKRRYGSKNGAGKISSQKNSGGKDFDGNFNDLYSVQIETQVPKIHENVNDVADEMEDGFEKLDEKEGDKMQVENEVENEPKKIVDDVIVDSIKMTSKDDGEASGRNIDDRVSKLLVDESDAASGFDPKKIVNIRKKVERASRSNKESWMNVPRRVSKRLREKSSSLVGSTTEDDYLVDLDRVVEQVTLDVGQVVEDPLQVYKGRTDFCGHDLVTDSERKAITSFLSREKLEYVLFPIGVRSHWFLLVWNNEKKEFVVRNSIDSSYDRTSARQFVEFLLGYLRLFKDLDLSNCTVGFPKCRVQGPNPDCGVFTCLWAKCYARDDPFTWNHQTDCKIDGIRAYVAAAILSDEYGLSKMS